MPTQIAAAYTATPIPWGTITSAVIAVAVATAVMIWMMLRTAKDTERAEKDPKFRARMLRGGAFCTVADSSLE